jgi:hypothetical protein
MSTVDDLTVAGYYACRKCGEWTPDGVGKRGYCPDCMKRLGEEARHLEIAYEVAGRKLVSRPTRSRPARPSRRDPERRRLWNRARSRAIQRLVRIHHPLYEVLLAQEKEALGLDPGLDVRSPGGGAIEREVTRLSA